MSARPLRILFVTSSLDLGGAERSLLRMVQALTRRGIHVDVLCLRRGGAFDEAFPSGTRVIFLKDRGFGDEFGRLEGSLRRAVHLVRRVPSLIADRLRMLPRIMALRSMRHDAVFMNLSSIPPWILSTCIRSNPVYMFVRNTVGKAANRDRILGFLRRTEARVRRYLCVSDEALAHFRTLFLPGRDRSERLYNLCGVEEIRRLAAVEEDPYPSMLPAQVRIVTVARLDEASKAILRMLRLHRRLLDEGRRHRWFLVGGGPDEGMIRRESERMGLAESFHLVGPVSNPYPWIRHADFVAILSRHEGLCGVVHESKNLGKPVIATDFAGAREQLRDGISGLIVGQDDESIMVGLRRMIDDEALRRSLAAVGLPPQLADDDAKVDRLVALCGASSTPAR